MKKLLITGMTGYIARSFLEFYSEAGERDGIPLKFFRLPGFDEAALIDVRRQIWREHIDFSKYSAVLHAAGIVHVKAKPREYYKVNRDLTFDLAQKAKAEGVKQFIFLSSAAVYGDRNLVNEDTIPVPANHYGMSKLEAEELLASLADENFKIAILRPPMVYGPDCPGNYARLRKLIKYINFFPDYKNRRENINISTLCSYIGMLITEEREGVFFPKEPEAVSTTSMAVQIAAEMGKELRLTKAFNSMITALMPYVPTLNKMFGDFVYVI